LLPAQRLRLLQCLSFALRCFLLRPTWLRFAPFELTGTIPIALH